MKASPLTSSVVTWVPSAVSISCQEPAAFSKLSPRTHATNFCQRTWEPIRENATTCQHLECGNTWMRLFPMTEELSDKYPPASTSKSPQDLTNERHQHLRKCVYPFSTSHGLCLLCLLPKGISSHNAVAHCLGSLRPDRSFPNHETRSWMTPILTCKSLAAMLPTCTRHEACTNCVVRKNNSLTPQHWVKHVKHLSCLGHSAFNHAQSSRVPYHRESIPALATGLECCVRLMCSVKSANCFR